MARTREDKALFHAHLRELADTLADSPHVVQLHATTMSGYSRRNVAMIHGQRPTASQVAGYRDWLKVGRQVAKGAKAIYVLAPIVRDKDTPDESVWFRAVPVFDIADTAPTAKANAA